MKIIEKEVYYELSDTDKYGGYQIRVFKDCGQIQMNTSDDIAFVNCNKTSLEALYDILGRVLKKQKP